jgi:hypothetical protein
VVEVEVGLDVLHVYVMCVCGILVFIEFCVFKTRNVCVCWGVSVLGKCYGERLLKFWVVGEYDAPLVLSSS